jgi:hypothetical protein
MIQGLYRLDSTRTSTSGVLANMNRRLGVYADSQGVFICIGQCVYVPDVFKDGIGFVCFFWTLDLATVRSR